MADLGEEAKEVMGQAVRQGLGQIVNDLGLGGDSEETSQPGTSVTGTGIDPRMKPNGSTTGLGGGERGGRKIHMPPGFPGTFPQSQRTTPLPTPGVGVGSSSRVPQTSNQGGQGAGMGSTSAYRNPAYAAQRNTASAGGISNDDAFRFRGQFSSQPPTPGVGGDERRRGALNSRAG
jgi:maintenance of morphology protein 1